MADFSKFTKQISVHLDKMSKGSPLFVVAVDKNEMWDYYLDSFPEGTNEVYNERRAYDCNSCRQFIKVAGALVSVNPDGTLVSIWDVKASDYYKDVAKKMSEYIKSKPIDRPFFHNERSIGVESTVEVGEDGKTKKWNHFHGATPAASYHQKGRDGSICSKVGELKTTYNVFKRSLEEITIEAAETVLELIQQNSIYRGQEFKSVVQSFIKASQTYDVVKDTNLMWLAVMKDGHSLRYRNTVIGTLLVDVSTGEDLDTAVAKFEQKVAPTNYKRPTALVTQSMINAARTKVNDLGLTDSLSRRMARETDITINNVLFADRSVTVSLDAFDDLAPTKPKKLNRTEEMTIDQFIENVLPTASSIEMLLESRLQNKLVSLIAPEFPSAKPLFKWNNGFSWSYVGEMTDSIKERVKAAGGVVDADVRVSLSWFNHDDLDLSVHIETGREPACIYFGARSHAPSGGMLDVDMNAGRGVTRTPVENIFWKRMNKMQEATYRVVVHNFAKRETKDVGFEVEFEHNGQVMKISHPDALAARRSVEVLTFSYSKNKKSGITILNSLNSRPISREVWGLSTEQFHKVSMVLNSPNHWDGEAIGNKHVFFMLDKCINPESARGFYNEFLRSELVPHRKVFEVLSAKMKAQSTDSQLSGVGFSTTQRDEVTLRVTGKTNRTIKVKF